MEEKNILSITKKILIKCQNKHTTHLGYRRENLKNLFLKRKRMRPKKIYLYAKIKNG